ncbi:MAG: UbiD family decarboxylase [Candidatus Tectomicrobia bacterium]|nr:UbiD family decarboxylase [Candidatus Tectomicrobia bacterium]
MPKDLRTFLAEIANEVITIRAETDPLTNCGTLISQSPGPLLMENLKGYPGWRLCDMLLVRRSTQAVALGTTPDRVVPELASLLAKGGSPTVRVSTGPVKEKKFIGDNLDLRQLLPVCVHSEIDLQPYIGAGMTIFRDPETGITNSSFIRTMIRPQQPYPMFIYSPHNNIILKKWWDRGERMPCVLVIGHHPAMEMAVNYLGPHLSKWGEMELASTLMREPVEMVPCETVDLEAPARAEIVIEGFIPPEVRLPEGPFGDFSNNYIPWVSDQPVLEVTAVTRREDAIYRHINSTMYTDHQALMLVTDAMIYDHVVKSTGTDIHEVFRPAWGGGICTVIQMTQHQDGDAERAMEAALEFPAGKMIITVDTDIDPHIAEDVVFALSTRVNPSRHINVKHNQAGFFFDPSSEPIPGKPYYRRQIGRAMINACMPPTSREAERKNYMRARPKGGNRFMLSDFLPKG